MEHTLDLPTGGTPRDRIVWLLELAQKWGAEDIAFGLYDYTIPDLRVLLRYPWHDEFRARCGDAYDVFNEVRSLMDVDGSETPLPAGRYDFRLDLPSGLLDTEADYSVLRMNSTIHVRLPRPASHD